MKPRSWVITAAWISIAIGSARTSAEENQRFDLKAGQELTFSVAIVNDQVKLSAPRQRRFGSAQPNEGEITIGLSPRDKTLYENVVVVEKTARPIDFVATGFVGGTKIDEAVLCGHLGQSSSSRIGAVSWRVSLNQFEVRKDGADCS